MNDKDVYLLDFKTIEEVKDFNDFIHKHTNAWLGRRTIRDLVRFIDNKERKYLLKISLNLKSYNVEFPNYLSRYKKHIFKYYDIDSFINDYREFIDFYENRYLVFKDLEYVVHIPHCSTDIPGPLNHFFYGMSYEDFHRYNLKMSDVEVDKLFAWIPGPCLKARLSRLYCDLERYKDNDKEPMYKYGQGYIYEKFYDGRTFNRYGIDNKDSFEIEAINRYYDNWHKQLTDTVIKQLSKGKDVLLLDIHSYSNDLPNSIGKKGPYPDICIGLNKDFDNSALLNVIIKDIEKQGYSYRINYPYEGSIMPQSFNPKYYKNKLYSIMIEVNKRIYL